MPAGKTFSTASESTTEARSDPTCFVLWIPIPFPKCHRLRRLHPPPTTRQQLGWRGLKVSCTVSQGVPCLRSCGTLMLVSSSSSDSARYPARCLLLASRAFRFPGMLLWSSLMCRPLVFFAASLVPFNSAIWSPPSTSPSTSPLSMGAQMC